MIGATMNKLKNPPMPKPIDNMSGKIPQKDTWDKKTGKRK